jgi:acyl carrier protein
MNLELLIAEEIIQCLQLEDLTPSSFPKDAPLFGSPSQGGMGFDSLASLEIIAALSNRLDLPFGDIQRQDMHSITTLVAYIRRSSSELDQGVG